MIRINGVLKKVFAWIMSAFCVFLSLLWLLITLLTASEEKYSGQAPALGYLVASIATLAFAFVLNPLARKHISFLSSNRNAFVCGITFILLASTAAGWAFNLQRKNEKALIAWALSPYRSNRNESWNQEETQADTMGSGTETSSPEMFGWPGLTVGMTLDQARAVIEKQGYPIASSPNPTPYANGDVAYVYDYIEPGTTNQIGTLQLGTALDDGQRYLYVAKLYPSGSRSSAIRTFDKLVSYYKDAYGTPTTTKNKGGESSIVFCVSKRVILTVITSEQSAGVGIYSSGIVAPVCAKAPESQRSAALYPTLPMRPMTEAEVAAANAASAATQNLDAKSAPLTENESADNAIASQVDSARIPTDAADAAASAAADTENIDSGLPEINELYVDDGECLYQYSDDMTGTEADSDARKMYKKYLGYFNADAETLNKSKPEQVADYRELSEIYTKKRAAPPHKLIEARINAEHYKCKVNADMRDGKFK